tara:strand:+ start:732 stop:1448 length:717 start_codon:yes stop_codon:yes gene_type:complete
MIALIYAAGSSIRIKKTIKIEHKSLLIIKKKKLIEHQLNWIKKTKVNKIVIVVNSKHQKLIKFISNYKSNIPLKIIYNNDEKSKNMKSFYLARKEIRNKSVIFTTSDLFCDKKNISKFLKSKAKNKILVDTNLKNYSGDEVLVKINENSIVSSCSKKINNFDGLAVGIYQFSSEFINKMINYCRTNNNDGYFDESLYYAIDNSIGEYQNIFPIQTVNDLWYDIDTYKEYILAKKKYEN